MTRSVPPASLDPAPTRFVGRGAELDALEAMIGEHRLVTVLGPPGAGKTRLAAQLAERLRASFAEAGGAWLVHLTEAASADAVAAAVGRALGVPLTAGSAAADTNAALGAAMAARGRMLVVLDDVEQAAAHAGAAIEVWLGAAREARFLVTSRARLAIAGEALFDLGPLSLPEAGADVAASEAVQLFVDRARRVRPGYRLDADEAPLVAELVRELDGLPLAIELAAARARVLSVAQLVQSLPRRFDVLTEDARPGAGRRRALWEEIDRSFALLAPAAQRALARCSVFRGGLTLDAAEEVLRPDAEDGAPLVLDLLQTLRDESLLSERNAFGERRFLPYLSVRDYAAERLAAMGDEAEACARHAAHYLRIGRQGVEQLHERDGHLVRRRLAEETDNLVAVHTRALAPAKRDGSGHEALEAAWILASVLTPQGPLGLCLSLLDAAFAATEGNPPGLPLLARALEAKVLLEVQLGSAARSLEACASLAARAEAAGEREALARALECLGVIETARGRFPEGFAYSERALALHTAAGHKAMEGRVLHSMALNRLESGRFGEARLLFGRALAILRKGDRLAEVKALNSVGVMEIEEGRLDEARAHLTQGLAAARAVGDRRAEAIFTGNLGAIDQERGDLDAAIRAYEASIDLHRRTGARRGEGHMLAFVGNARFEQGRLDEALASYEAALDLLEELGWRASMVLPGLAAARAAIGDVAGAEATFARAEDELARLGNQRLSAALCVHEGHLNLARAREAATRGDAEAAASLVARARRRMTDALVDPDPRGAAASGPALAVESTDVRIALRCLRRALAAHAPAAVEPSRDALRVGKGCSWFRAPGGEAVSLDRRRSLRLLLDKLVEARLAAPGAVLSAASLVAAGWPGEDVSPEAGASRVYTALSTLRKLGLRALIQSADDGYRLDPEVPVARGEKPA
ncbi:MAG: tetratricopeptide repeat protein [Minicystis sp.]